MSANADRGRRGVSMRQRDMICNARSRAERRANLRDRIGHVRTRRRPRARSGGGWLSPRAPAETLSPTDRGCGWPGWPRGLLWSQHASIADSDGVAVDDGIAISQGRCRPARLRSHSPYAPFTRAPLPAHLRTARRASARGLAGRAAGRRPRRGSFPRCDRRARAYDG